MSHEPLTLLVAALQLLDGRLNVLHTALSPHLLGRKVAVQASAVPVTWDWLGRKRDAGTKDLGDAAVPPERLAC